jgi:5'-nucleotidase/UDP-sugar diphosphatase
MLLSRRALLGTAALPWIRLSQAQPARVLSVLHQNDFHSRHEPVDRGGAACRGPAGCAGGAARLATLVARERQIADADQRAHITLDAGDQFMGSLFYTHWRGDAELAVLRAIGFDAMAVGNHEFDHGPANFARFVAAAPFPVVAANIDAARESALAGLLRRSVIIDRPGMRIGVFGLTTEATPQIASPGPNLRFLNAIAAAAETAAALRQAGAGTVIALSHLGLTEDRALVRATQNIDLVVGGHSHTLLSNTVSGAPLPCPVVETATDGRAVPIVQAGANGRFVGRIDLALDAAGRAAAFRGDAREITLDTPEDAAVAALLAQLALPIEATRRRVVGQVSGDFSPGPCRGAECALGNLVADAMLDAARPAGAELAITNVGGLRAPLSAGAVTLGDVLAVLPFSNTLATFTLSGAALRAALEHGVSVPADGTGSGRFPQVAGLAFGFDPRRAPGTRLLAVELVAADGTRTPLDDARRYRVVSNNFLRQGGDGYAVFRDQAQDAYDNGPPMEEAMVAHFAARGRLAPRLDGRIRVAR